MHFSYVFENIGVSPAQTIAFSDDFIFYTVEFRFDLVPLPSSM
jgi:hypothetical protein